MDYKKNAVQNAGVIEKKRDKNDRAMKWLNERNDIQRDQGGGMRQSVTVDQWGGRDLINSLES